MEPNYAVNVAVPEAQSLHIDCAQRRRAISFARDPSRTCARRSAGRAAGGGDGASWQNALASGDETLRVLGVFFAGKKRRTKAGDCKQTPEKWSPACVFLRSENKEMCFSERQGRAL